MLGCFAETSRSADLDLYRIASRSCPGAGSSGGPWPGSAAILACAEAMNVIPARPCAAAQRAGPPVTSTRGHPVESGRTRAPIKSGGISRGARHHAELRFHSVYPVRAGQMASRRAWASRRAQMRSRSSLRAGWISQGRRRDADGAGADMTPGGSATPRPLRRPAQACGHGAPAWLVPRPAP